MSLLCQPAFRALMERAAEEFGFGQAGGLRVPCCEEDFVATVAALLPNESRQRRRSAAGGRRSASVNCLCVEVSSIVIPFAKPLDLGALSHPGLFLP
ncbi:hypothetical protein ACQ4PT_021869 [Festuca glaucescens]